MTEYTASVVSSVTASVIAAGGVTTFIIFLCKTYLGERIKSSIQHEYSQRLEFVKTQLKLESDASLEALKSQLKSEADRELESLKAGLSRANAEHYARFTQLEARRANAINDVYAAIQLCRLNFQILTNPGFTYPPDVQATAAQEFHNSFQECRRGTLINLIYFQAETSQRLLTFVEVIGHTSDGRMPVNRSSSTRARTCGGRKGIVAATTTGSAGSRGGVSGASVFPSRNGPASSARRTATRRRSPPRPPTGRRGRRGPSAG